MRIVKPKSFADRRNPLETRYDREVLHIRRFAGEIRAYAFEAITLKLANGLTYRPDYCVELNTGDSGTVEIEFHEVKGFWRDDARAKIKMAAEQFRWATFIAATWNRKTGWAYETFLPRKV